ncbi:cbb3-type cytochrome c oxidase subunit 3 [uncultured Sulfitobacter sp.]|uniref:cbb3-type cytochrome c oxidase subunit 3 n=1 Tax=uncultured Sulfitobacter sp. TaxID=191468 RepID=UPI00261DE58D|nr:cbb3-type cytochrome c oxidase subunit 3 [uncultured Sulfitobacter sp.]
MDTYSFLRQLADSWVMLGIFGFFIGACIWAFLPSQASAREDASMIPMRDDVIVKKCSGGCDDCSRTSNKLSMKGLSNG